MEWRLLASVSLEIIVWLILQPGSLLTCLYFTHYLESFEFVKSIAQLAMGLAQLPLPHFQDGKGGVELFVKSSQCQSNHQANIYLYMIYAH